MQDMAPPGDIDAGKPPKHHTRYPRLEPDAETVAREIEQLRSMVDDAYEARVPSPKPVMQPPEDLPKTTDSEFDLDVAKDQSDKKYDMSVFDDLDLQAIKDIRTRAGPVKDRNLTKEALEKADVHTLAHSIDYAESQLQERLRKNLDMYHDLKKLREKDNGEFTSQDLQFVQNAVCPDGKCFSGSAAVSSLAAIATAVCVYLF